jgi:NAD(P)-dependent dehydrogenase (short-subunit alcohol dehydrogenase family)
MSTRTFHGLSDLSGRRALVTGAAGGIGRVMAQTLAELGADLVLVDRPGAVYEAIAGQAAEDRRVAVETIDCDLELTDERERLIRRVSEGRLDILINNAAFVGTSNLEGWATAFEQQSLDTWRRALEVNLTAAFHLTKGLSGVLRDSGRGSIINVASIYGQYGPDYSLYEGTALGNPAAYGASKGGLIQLTRWLATTLAPGVRVNAISPGGVQRQQPASFVDRYVARTPLGRMATEDDFRGVVGFLAGDLSAYVTGQVIAVDGGWGVW